MKTPRIIYSFVATGVRVLWRAFSLTAKKSKKPQIAFLSRQYDRPFDFAILESELKKRFPNYKIVWSCKRENRRVNPLQAVKHIRLAATSRICLTDCYIPGISIPKHHDGSLYIQIWHAIGAIKKFGYQSVGTKQGRNKEMANALSMHCGYDAVIAGLPGFVSDLAEAFDTDPSKIFAVGTPRVDFFLSDSFATLRTERAMRFRERHSIDWANPDDFIILYVPTFRRIKQDDRDGYIERADKVIGRLVKACGTRPSFKLIISLHLHQKYRAVISAGVSESPSSVNVTMIEANSIDAMLISNVIITDYSAIAFEAALLEKPVYFLATDYESYRGSPGLNIDPFEKFPEISFTDPEQVVSRIESDRQGLTSYESSGFSSFMTGYCDGISEGSIQRVCDVIATHLSSC